MDNFYNIVGADIGSLAGGFLGTGIGIIMAKQSQKDAKRLQQQLEQLSNIQIDDLNQKLLSVKNEIEKETLFFKYLAEQQQNKIAKETKNRRIITGVALGLGTLIAIVLIIKLRKQHEQRH